MALRRVPPPPPAKFETLSLSVSFSHWHVKGLSSKPTALNVIATGPESILFAAASVHLSAQKFYRLEQ